MTAFTNSARIFARSELGWDEWYAAHPALPWPIKFDLREPGRISPLDTISFEAGRVSTSGQCVDDMQAELARRFDLTERQAECIVDAWAWAVSGGTPTFVVDPIANV